MWGGQGAAGRAAGGRASGGGAGALARAGADVVCGARRAQPEAGSMSYKDQRASGYRIDSSLPGPTGRTPLRDHTYARPANAQSFGDYASHHEIGDVVLAENERIVCVERLTTQTIEQPIVVHEERLQEKAIPVPKPVTRKTTTERPVIQPLRKPVQVVREVGACWVAPRHARGEPARGPKTGLLGRMPGRPAAERRRSWPQRPGA